VETPAEIPNQAAILKKILVKKGTPVISGKAWMPVEAVESLARELGISPLFARLVCVMVAAERVMRAVDLCTYGSVSPEKSARLVLVNVELLESVVDGLRELLQEQESPAGDTTSQPGVQGDGGDG